MAEGPETGLRLLDELSSSTLDGYHLFHAVRANVLRRARRQPEALAAYRRAIALAANDVERSYLERRVGELTEAESKA